MGPQNTHLMGRLYGQTQFRHAVSHAFLLDTTIICYLKLCFMIRVSNLLHAPQVDARFLLAVMQRGLRSPGPWNAASDPSCFSRLSSGRKCWNPRFLGKKATQLLALTPFHCEQREGSHLNWERGYFTFLVTLQKLTPKTQHLSRWDMTLVTGSHLDDGLRHL